MWINNMTDIENANDLFTHAWQMYTRSGAFTDAQLDKIHDGLAEWASIVYDYLTEWYADITDLNNDIQSLIDQDKIDLKIYEKGEEK